MMRRGKMSHVSTIELEVSDLDALEKAASSCGLEMVRNQTSIRWYGRWVRDYHGDDAAYKHGISPETYGKCSHALRVPNNNEAYEVGILDNGDGTYKIYFDHWGPGKAVVDRIGRYGEKLKQQYVKVKAIQALQKKGFTLQSEEGLESGSLKVTLKGQVALT